MNSKLEFEAKGSQLLSSLVTHGVKMQLQMQAGQIGLETTSGASPEAKQGTLEARSLLAQESE